MQKLAPQRSIHSPQQPLALLARVIDSLGIGLALYIAIMLSDTDEGWSRVHAFYSLLAILLMQFYSEFFHVYQNWKIKNNSWSRIWMLGISSLSWFFTCLTLLGIAILFDQSIKDLDWVLAAYWIGITLVMFALIRLLLNFAIRYARSQGINVRRVAIAGGGPMGRFVLEQIDDNPWIGYSLAGVFDNRSQKESQNESIINRRKREAVGAMKKGLQVHGNFRDLVDRAAKNDFDAVFIALPMRAEHKTQEIIRQLAARTTTAVYVVPDFYSSFEAHFTHLVDINGIPAVSVYENPVSGLRGIVKRLEDIVFALAIITLIFPWMILIAAAVKLTSRGPIIFKQKRYGLDGKPITVWKFRTMSVLENGLDFQQAVRNDPRITRVGAVMRRYSLDELPQFFNVLGGSMSIVGPRPHAVAHNEAFRDSIGGYMLRHKTKPGITGWAQINGFRGETDSLEKMRSRVAYDIDYIKQWSLLLDIKIILLTVVKGFTGDHVF